MILAGDIGGTKTELALYEQEGKALRLRARCRFASGAFATFAEVVDAFMAEHQGIGIDAACFGIAGPVIAERCRTTNLPWEISAEALRQRLGTQKVRLLNDLEAIAYGMLCLGEGDFAELNPSARSATGNCAVIAAGTGLGEAQLYFDGARYHPIGSEGGHCDFAPQDAQQDALLVWLRERFPGHVSYERLLSGPGVAALYDFLDESGFAPAPEAVQNLPEGEDRSAAISRCALEEGDPLCFEALRLFAVIYGAEAGNLALKSMALGGLYVGGGIAPKILPLLERHFMEGFLAKGRFAELLRALPVRVALNPDTALIGSARFAAERL